VNPRKIFIISIFAILSHSINASNNNDSTYFAIEVKYQYGVLVPHHPEIVYFVKDYVQGFEINFIRRRYKTDFWESDYKRLETGIGFWCSSLGRDEIYGHAMSLFPFVNLHLVSIGKLDFKTRVALGLGFATKPFERYKNPFNSIFSSHFNAYIGLGFMMYYPVFNNFALQGGLSINHISNGASSKPNHGMNTVAISFGARYNLTEPKQFALKKHDDKNFKKNELLTTISAGRNQPSHYFYNKYWSGSVTAIHSRYLKKNMSLGIGLDLINIGGAPYVFNSSDEIDENAQFEFKDFFYLGSTLNFENHFGKTAIYLAPGVYLHYKTTPRQPLYARLGIRQIIYGNFWGHFGIKANFFVAEFIEFGVGYRLKY